jgi:phosphatidylglycerophosphate synthase
VLAPDPATVRALVTGDDHVTMEVEYGGHAGTLEDAGGALIDAAERLPERFWCVTADRVVSPALFPKLEPDDPAPVAVVDARGGGVGTYLLTRGCVQARGAGVRDRPVALDALVERAEAEGGPRQHVVEQAVWHVVREPADIARARDVLLRALRKPLGRQADGVVAYYVNRAISIPISAAIVNTAITPNLVTFIALLVGLAAAVLVADGRWAWMVIGGLALQLSSVLDGVDGEIARLRLTTSHAGEWFDTVCDDVINIGFMLGLGLGCYHRSENGAYLMAAVIGAAVAVVVVAVLYRNLVVAGLASHNALTWGFERPPGEGRRGLFAMAMLVFSYAAKRDSYTVILLGLIVLDLPTVALVAMVVGIGIVASGLLVQLAASSFSAARGGG